MTTASTWALLLRETRGRRILFRFGRTASSQRSQRCEQSPFCPKLTSPFLSPDSDVFFYQLFWDAFYPIVSYLPLIYIISATTWSLPLLSCFLISFIFSFLLLLLFAFSFLFFVLLRSSFLHLRILFPVPTRWAPCTNVLNCPPCVSGGQPQPTIYTTIWQPATSKTMESFRHFNGTSMSPKQRNRGSRLARKAWLAGQR